MKKNSFDEMIAYFNRRVSEMDIDQDYKMELLGMVTAIGYKHEQTAQQWIPCSERLPEVANRYLVTCSKIGNWEVDWNIWHNEPKPSWLWEQGVTAWMPLPEPYKGGQNDASHPFADDVMMGGDDA